MLKPYYDHNGITIYHGDCREILPQLEPVDLVLTDPPYGVGYRKAGEPYMAGDNINMLPIVLPILYTKVVETGALFIFSSTEHLRESLISFQTYFKMHNIVIWDKGIPTYPHSNAHFNMQYEPIIYGSRGLHKLVNGHCSDIIRADIVRGHNRKHPAQKPIELIIKLLEACEGNLIVDPFMGSGTTLVAAQSLGRKCIGIEIEGKHVQTAIGRLSQEVLF